MRNISTIFIVMDLYYKHCAHTVSTKQFLIQNNNARKLSQLLLIMAKSRQQSLALTSLADDLPFDIVIPAVFLSASAICYADPGYAPSICFFILGSASIIMGSVVKYYTKPTAQTVSEVLTDSLVSFADDRNQDQSDKLFGAVSKVLSKTMDSDALNLTVKNAVVGLLTNDELHALLLVTLHRAMIKASDDEELQQTLSKVAKKAFVGALSDKQLLEDLMNSVVDAIVNASQNERLNKNMLDVITLGMSNAFEDERFVSVVRGAVKDTLKDRTLYQAGAKGLLSAANPFANMRQSSINSAKDESLG